MNIGEKMAANLKKYSAKGRRNKGFVLAVSMIFMLVFSVLAVTVASKSNTNLQIANTHRKSDKSLAASQSGLEILRYHLTRISFAEAASPDDVVKIIKDNLAADLPADMDISYSGDTIRIAKYPLDPQQNTSFEAEMTWLAEDIQTYDDDMLEVKTTGYHKNTAGKEITRRVKADFDFGIRANQIFNYGVASRGPLSLEGNVDLDGVEVAVEASAYIEAAGWDTALSITGNSQIAGDVEIANPYADVDLQGGKASIGGETGDEAINNHVTKGVPPPEFPIANTDKFEKYVTTEINSTTDISSEDTYENVRIAPGTNPTFSSKVILNGVVFVETPNIVEFQGGAEITGIIVGDGDVADDSGTNQINFTGNVTSYDVSTLPDEPQFEGLREETGTFVIAPGFSVSFGGNFNTPLNGAIAANGVEFYGNAGGTISGSIINYADNQTTFTGNSDLYFNRSGIEEVPAGFEASGTVDLTYDPNSYSEPPA
jgi:hypothetical protein